MTRKFLLCSIAILLTRVAFATADVEKSKDYSLIQRWPHSYIAEYSDKDFDAFEFDTPDQNTRIEGRTLLITYNYEDGIDQPSNLKFSRNFQNALKKGGWTVLSGPNDDFVVAKLVKDGKEVWCEVKPDNGCYRFSIVEKGEMKQEVTANDMLDQLNAEGHIALEINFDSSKAIIKEDSKPVIEQMIKLLKDNPDLNVEIQGHTDNTGAADADQVLSEQRAKAVTKALEEGGIPSARMTAVGYGLTKPVADNSTPEGRAKNRRVELVKK